MKKKVVVVAGGFDPIHIGHVRLFNEARTLGSKLIVIVNNDEWLITKKGFIFMPAIERAEVIRAFRAVDEVIISSHVKNDPDRSVSRELERIRPDILANGGDRSSPEHVYEAATCRRLGIEMRFGVGGGKVQSSSLLTDSVRRDTGRPVPEENL